MKLRRKISQYQGCDPSAMCEMSKGAIFYAFDDAKHDILALHEQNAELLAALKDCRKQLQEYHLLLNGEDYNDPTLNALIQRAEGNQ